MDKQRLLELAGIISEQTEHEENLSDLYKTLLHEFDGVPKEELKEFLQQIAAEFGIDLQ